MTRYLLSRLLPAVLIALFAAGTALAEKPDGAGQGKGKDKGAKHAQHERSGDKGNGQRKSVQQPQKQDVRVGAYFGAPQRTAVNEYYGKQYSAGRCPPGLAKKNNGCMPPGQAKKWAVGQPLPRDVVFYPLPRSVVIQLGAPPAGHKYVRVASDILLIAIGSSMVMDAIQDLGRL